MNSNDKVIKAAIEGKKQLNIKVHIGDKSIEIPFQPYIYGDDILQFEFVWGYLPVNMTFYKILVSQIDEVQITAKTFEIIPNSCYLYAVEEEHYARIDGFRNIFVGEPPLKDRT